MQVKMMALVEMPKTDFKPQDKNGTLIFRSVSLTLDFLETSIEAMPKLGTQK